ncbi:uncharacterized protein AKAW2_70799A [Aspergillus luchuensis]|uniref:C6 transcription factor n=1 Tax=Aspergillus kawachii TaxID=1069201 RepID=A0A146G0D4_ASPKA|nr:uncharacterized protein AKAW2_70799A [Aspergillus luchuensis]BCS03921.1 hypothetical protein AKAW2_70799A [Aspergillus luchuensis]GAT30609.1 C6 transcription factor [Aspergillus luchuensis]
MGRTELQTEGTPDASQIKLAWRIMQPQKGTRARSSIGANPRRKASLLKPWPGGVRTAQQRSAGPPTTTTLKVRDTHLKADWKSGGCRPCKAGHTSLIE